MSDLLKKRAATLNETGTRGVTFYGITVGRVVSTDDPQQMGRLYVLCPELGDPPNLDSADFTNLPLCSYMTPFGGSTGSDHSRGPSDEFSKGPMTYGMWAIPKRGALVGVMCINGNPNQRVWVGSIYEHLETNTLPHGRFFYEDDDGTIPHPKGAPHGPLTGADEPIQPIYDNQTQAFKSRLGNFEWRTRGADFQCTGIIGDDNLSQSSCVIEDDSNAEFKQEDGTTINITQGLVPSRDNEGANDNQTYSWTTPGFHSISLDDRLANCRIKLRTAAGHQIIMDDSNERIYINTAKGNNWIEIDEDGSIDIFSAEKLSATAKHINFTAEETLRLYGKTGVHIKSDTEIRIQSGTTMHTTVGTNKETTIRGFCYLNVDGNIDINTESNLKQTAKGNIDIKAFENFKQLAEGNFDIKTSIGLKLTATNNIESNAGSSILSTSGGTNETKAGGNIIETAPQIHMNGPSASPATEASPADPAEIAKPDPAFFTNRYPLHEPWARTSTKDDLTHDPKYEYKDPEVGREHKVRGPNWRR